MMRGVGVTIDSCNVEEEEEEDDAMMNGGTHVERHDEFNFYINDAYVDEMYRAL